MKFLYLRVCLIALCFSCFTAYKLHTKNQNYNDSTIETTLFLKVSDKRDILNNPNEFLTHTVLINSNLIYYFEKEKNLKKISGSIALKSLITSNDDPASGKCCVTIGSLESLETSNKNTDFLCFTLDGKDEKWQICSKDQQIINDFRSTLLLKVIEASFSSKSKPPSAKILVNFDNSNKCLAPSKSDWDYSYQTSWDCFCNIGLYQSPIPLTESPTMKISHGVLSFKYTKAQNPIAVPKNHREIDIHGNFGSLIYQISEKEAQRFVSYKISFKFPSEHRINGKEYPLEVVVFHRNKESLEEAALSILVKEDSKGETELNKFFEDIDSQTWSFDEEVSIQSKPDLRYLVAGEDGESRKGFFSYMGSRSNPPCNENVERFVFKKALKIPISQLMSLKKKASKGNNARIVKEETNRRIMVYYNKGKKTLEKDREVEREIRGQVKEKLDRTKNRLFPKKYVKVSTNTTDYIIAKSKENNLITGELNKTVYVNFVKENDLPDSVRYDLMKK